MICHLIVRQQCTTRFQTPFIRLQRSNTHIYNYYSCISIFLFNVRNRHQGAALQDLTIWTAVERMRGSSDRRTFSDSCTVRLLSHPRNRNERLASPNATPTAQNSEWVISNDLEKSVGSTNGNTSMNFLCQWYTKRRLQHCWQRLVAGIGQLQLIVVYILVIDKLYSIGWNKLLMPM